LHIQLEKYHEHAYYEKLDISLQQD
jgi:hypothetical protein